MTSRIFVDANVLLEILLERDKHLLAVRELEKHAGNLYISALSGHLCMYFGIKLADIKAVRNFLADFEILPLDNSNFEWAYMNVRDGDFEDCLQLATAIQHGCDTFMTFDKKLAATYEGLPVITIKLLA